MAQEQKVTLSSIRYFCVLMAALMLLIYGALILSSNNYQTIYESTIVKTGDQQLELVNFECPVPIGASQITNPSDCKIHRHRSELNSVKNKLSDLETSKRKTLKCSLVLFAISLLCSLLQCCARLFHATIRKVCR